mgnify:CR=1 FL=1
MKLCSLEKKLYNLEQSRLHNTPEADRTFERFAMVAEDLRREGIPEDELSTRALCFIATDWNNPFDMWRIMGFLISTRKELGAKWTELDDTDELRQNLIPQLRERGVSTAENTRLISGDFPPSDFDRELANELCRYTLFQMDHEEEVNKGD